jgi:hypothetical protein
LAAGDDDVHLEADKLLRQCGKTFETAVGPSVLEFDISPFNIAKFAQALFEGVDKGAGRATQYANAMDLPSLWRPSRHGHGEHQNGHERDGGLSSDAMATHRPRASQRPVISGCAPNAHDNLRRLSEAKSPAGSS